MPAEKVVIFYVSKTVRFDFMTLVQSTLGITLTTTTTNNNNNNTPTLIIIINIHNNHYSGTDISMDISSLDDLNPTNYNDRIKQCKSSYILGNLSLTINSMFLTAIHRN